MKRDLWVDLTSDSVNDVADVLELVRYGRMKHSRSGTPVFALRGHAVAVNCVEFLNDANVTTTNARVVFSSDSKLLSGDLSGKIRLWDLHSRRTTLEFDAHDAKGVLSLSRGLDANTFFSQGREGVVKAWDLSGRCSTPFLEIRTGSYSFCRMATGTMERLGPVIASPSSDQTKVKLWDLRSGDVLSCIDTEVGNVKKGMCSSIELCGSLVATGSESGEVDVWDPRQLSAPRMSYKLHSQPVFAMTLNESLGGGITGSADGCLKAFQMDEVNNQISQRALITIPAEGVSRLASRADRKLFAACCWDFNVYLYSWKTLRLLGTLAYHSASVFDVAFAPNSCSGAFATASKDRAIAVYCLFASPKQLPAS